MAFTMGVFGGGGWLVGGVLQAGQRKSLVHIRTRDHLLHDLAQMWTKKKGGIPGLFLAGVNCTGCPKVNAEFITRLSGRDFRDRK